MITIWKYVLVAEKCQEVLMPAGATILHVAVQSSVQEHAGRTVRQEDLYLWVVGDSAAAKVPRRIIVVATGAAIDGYELPTYRYIGTVHLADGALVFHVFEVLS